MSRTTQEPQRTHSANADAEWKADPGLGEIAHGAGGGDDDGSAVDRSAKAAPLPEGVHEMKDDLTSGGSRGLTGQTGDGKGPLNPEAEGSKKEDSRN